MVGLKLSWTSICLVLFHADKNINISTIFIIFELKQVPEGIKLLFEKTGSKK
jgi:hypothetical protein